jgi:hypothetical protein
MMKILIKLLLLLTTIFCSTVGATEEMVFSNKIFPLTDWNPQSAQCYSIKNGVAQIPLINLGTNGISIPDRFSISIWNGSFKNFAENSRAKDVKLTIFGALRASAFDGVEDESMFYLELKKIYSTSTTLKDSGGFQTIPLTHLEKDSPYEELALSIEIESIYKGSNINQVCLSEVVAIPPFTERSACLEKYFSHISGSNSPPIDEFSLPAYGCKENDHYLNSATSYLFPAEDYDTARNKWLEIVSTPNGDKLETFTNWLCRYSPDKAFDKKLDTAWCEGVKDQGVGEKYYYLIGNEPSPVEIFSGLAKSKETFLNNSRPKELLVTLWEARGKCCSFHSGSEKPFACGVNYDQMQKLGEKVITLEDSYSYQKLIDPQDISLAPLKIGSFPYAISIEILSVYPGKQYKDCCISEIKSSNVGVIGY